jgi:phage tail-like protein
MDANGQRFWTLAEEAHWPWRSHARWDGACRALRLASERTLAPPEDAGAAHAAANTALERVPRVVDEVDAVAWWSPGDGAVVARSTLPGLAVLLPLPEAPTDLVVGFDGVLYVVGADGVRLHDLRGRWGDVTVEAEGFAPWRAAADPRGGIWLLERASGRLARLTGMPMTVGPYLEYAGTTFRPDPENCRPPTITVLPGPAWDVDERPVALACPVGGAPAGPALLSWIGGEGSARLRLWDEKAAAVGEAYTLTGALWAYALAFVRNGTAVVRVPGRVDAPAFELGAADPERRLRPSGDVYPLAETAVEAPFAHRVDGPPRYPADGEDGPTVEPLHRLSLTNLARRGEARHFTDEDVRPLDSGDPRTVWHRLYAEARVPAGTGFVVWLAATPDPAPPPADDVTAWHPHAFGESPLPEPQAPRAARERAPSELPHHPGLGQWPTGAEDAGLWSALIQHPRRRVRRLEGRYLWMRVELFGDGRVGPEIAALRAWASRFSYRDRYLPRLYRESRFGAPALEPGQRVAELEVERATALDAGGPVPEPLRARLAVEGVTPPADARIRVDVPGERWLLGEAGGRAWRLQREETPSAGAVIGVYRPQATPADFLERMLGNFEGVLTPMEDRIEAAHLLTDPAAVPDAHLDWLGAWIGVTFDPALPASRRRAWLTAAPEMARRHGTRRGLELALDVASGGGVSGGEIVVLEDFRLRRLLATLLGVDLGVEDDPLLPGLIVSGNSVVGDTLALGEAERVELLALFREEVATARENQAVLAFYEKLAFRATVLVHRGADEQDLGLLRRVVELESPAHALVRVVAATWPLLVGVASLVGVDTYLGPKPPRRPARVDVSAASQDYVVGPATVDPRLAGAAAAVPTEPPVADAGEDLVTFVGTSFELDGSRSRAAPGRRIETYRWRRLPPE